MKSSVVMLFLALVYALSSVTTSFAAGRTEKTTVEAQPTVSILVTSDQPADPGAPVLRELAARTGIELVPSYVSRADQVTRRSTLIASGDLPDILATIPTLDMLEYAKHGVAVPIDDLLAQHGPTIMENRAEYYTRFPGLIDGKIYGVPQGEAHVDVLAIRRDWLDAVGLPVPQTLDEYYETMKAFVESDPNQSGARDTYGALTYATAALNPFSHVFAAYGIPFRARANIYLDGRVIPPLLHPNYLDAIRFFRRLYNEGLMNDNFATTPPLQALELLWTGRAGSFAFSPMGTTQNWIGRYTEDPKPVFEWTVLEGPDGKKGTTATNMFDTGWSVVTSKARDPEHAIKLMNFLNTIEGSLLTSHGIEGVHYEMSAGVPAYLPPYDTDAALHRREGAFTFSGIAGHLTDGLKTADVMMLNDVTREGYRFGREHIMDMAFIQEEPAIMRDVGETLADIQLEALLNLIVTSENRLESEYERFVRAFMDAGGATWVEQATEIFKREQGL